MVRIKVNSRWKANSWNSIYVSVPFSAPVTCNTIYRTHNYSLFLLLSVLLKYLLGKAIKALETEAIARIKLNKGNFCTKFWGKLMTGLTHCLLFSTHGVLTNMNWKFLMMTLKFCRIFSHPWKGTLCFHISGRMLWLQIMWPPPREPGSVFGYVCVGEGNCKVL